jgi:hypothetical protein
MPQKCHVEDCLWRAEPRYFFIHSRQRTPSNRQAIVKEAQTVADSSSQSRIEFPPERSWSLVSFEVSQLLHEIFYDLSYYYFTITIAWLCKNRDITCSLFITHIYSYVVSRTEQVQSSRIPARTSAFSSSSVSSMWLGRITSLPPGLSQTLPQ